MPGRLNLLVGTNIQRGGLKEIYHEFTQKRIFANMKNGNVLIRKGDKDGDFWHLL
jgi:hypothetical protein